MGGFVDKLHAAARGNGSLLCVGLDPDPTLMPVEDVAAFNRAIVEATSDLVCAYKPNLAFYEALGMDGLRALGDTLEYIREKAPNVVVIGDAKRGDVGSTAKAYARALFDVWGFDAATVNAWGGRDALQPFLDYTDRGVLVWCRGSNPGARDFQDLAVTPPYGGDTLPMYEWVAMQALTWNDAGNVGLVVGATYPDELRRIRELCPTLPILLPGVGAQQGALEASLENGVDERGQNLIVSASRSILYASSDPGDYADAARREAEALRDRINAVLEERGLTGARGFE